MEQVAQCPEIAEFFARLVFAVLFHGCFSLVILLVS